jgi:hypothetical protein
MALFSCFVFEPFFALVGIYQMLNWKTYYGLPLYFAIGVVAKAAMSLVLKVEAKYGRLPV